MIKRKECYYCDKCKKEIKENECVYHEPYHIWYYDLCSKCFEEFEEFYSKIKKIKNKWEKLEQQYEFGEYLPKDEGDK